MPSSASVDKGEIKTVSIIMVIEIFLMFSPTKCNDEGRRMISKILFIHPSSLILHPF
jgi:hypothetical protein